MNAALAACVDFIESLSRELADYCAGAVGVHQSMRLLLDAAIVACDWERLLHQQPEAKRITAFREVWRLLAPSLSRTTWPDIERFPLVQHEWPSEALLCVQYVVLLRRLREAAAERGHWYRMWYPVTQYQVVSVAHSGKLFRLVRQCLGKRLCKGGATIVSLATAVVLEFLHGRVSLGNSFLVSSGGVCALGAGRTFARMRSRKAQHVFKGGLGSYASLVHHDLAGKWVQVVGVRREIDVGAVAASIDLGARFSQPAHGGRHCWHVARILHRLRHVRGVEVACERWGSLLHSLWDDVAGPLLMLQIIHMLSLGSIPACE